MDRVRANFQELLKIVGHFVINPRPVGVCRATPEISRTTQLSDKRQTVLDSPWRELSKACKFFENRGHMAGQTEVKRQILLVLQWRLLRPNKAL